MILNLYINSIIFLAFYDINGACANNSVICLNRKFCGGGNVPSIKTHYIKQNFKNYLKRKNIIIFVVLLIVFPFLVLYCTNYYKESERINRIIKLYSNNKGVFDRVVNYIEHNPTKYFEINNNTINLYDYYDKISENKSNNDKLLVKDLDYIINKLKFKDVKKEFNGGTIFFEYSENVLNVADEFGGGLFYEGLLYSYNGQFPDRSSGLYNNKVKKISKNLFYCNIRLLYRINM